MAVDASKVLVGALDQATTGAVLDAPVGTALPTDLNSALNAAFKDSGYISSDGISMSTDYSTKDITEANGAAVRKLLEKFDGTIKYTELEMSERSATRAFGKESVTATAATTAHGNQLKIAIGARLPEVRSWVFKMKDGAAKMMIIVPRGQAIPPSDTNFQSSDAISLAIEMQCQPDAQGNSIYILTDDGVVTR